MFLLERTISLLVYAFALFVAYQLIARVARKQYKVVLLMYLIALAIFAFNYKPYITADLYRLREYIEYWIHKDLNGVLKYAMRSSTFVGVVFICFVTAGQHKLDPNDYMSLVLWQCILYHRPRNRTS